MSPDFDELLDGEAVPSAEELAELRNVHELLLSASPPPKLPRRLARPRRVRSARLRLTRRRVGMALALSGGALAAGAFALGYGAGHGGSVFQPSFARFMHGLPPAPSASATIEVGKRDGSGNWPLEMTVRGLPALPRHDWYDLVLTERGKPDVLCGAFRAGAELVTRVWLNAPSDFDEHTGWVVTAHLPGRPSETLLST